MKIRPRLAGLAVVLSGFAALVYVIFGVVIAEEWEE